MKKIKLFDEFSANQVQCDNCGWKWRLEDGGEDPFICHECGHDNSPIEIKDEGVDWAIEKMKEIKK